jgi:hypothetical protein
LKLIPFRGSEKFLGTATVTKPSPSVSTSPAASPSDSVSHSASNELKVGNDIDVSTLFNTPKAVQVGVDAQNREKVKQMVGRVSMHQQMELLTPEEAQLDTEEESIRDYTTEEVKAVWDKFLIEFAEEHKQPAAAMEAAGWQFEKNQLSLFFIGTPQMESFNEHRSTLMNYFRSNGMPGIRLQATINIAEVKVKEFISDRTRFDRMREMNPAIEELWRRFKLVID